VVPVPDARREEGFMKPAVEYFGVWKLVGQDTHADSMAIA
jgi:hypothetical protein